MGKGRGGSGNETRREAGFDPSRIFRIFPEYFQMGFFLKQQSVLHHLLREVNYIRQKWPISEGYVLKMPYLITV